MRNGFPVFDTHVHMGTARHSGRRQTAEDLLRGMDAGGVERSLVIPFPVVDDYRGQHDEIARAVRQWPDRFAGCISLYPYVAEAEFRDEARRCVEVHGFRALKLQPQYHPINPLWATSRFFFETAALHNLPIVAHTGTGIPYALPSMMMLPAREFPELRIVLAHCGGGGIFVAEAIIAALFCPNIWLELSSLLPHQVLEVAHRVPAHRLMIGSDLPENLDFEIGKIAHASLPAETRREILFDTAARLFDGAV